MLVVHYSLAAVVALEVPAEECPDTLTGGWAARARAEDRGVAPFAVWTTEGWGNVAGGLEQRGWWNSLLEFGFEMDTAKLGWWQGGSFMVQTHWVQNLHNDTGFSDDTGGFNPVSSIEAGDQLRIFNLHYRQSWREDAIALKLGQVAVDDDFMTSDYASLFLNSAFGAMPSQVGTPLATSSGNIPAFPIYSVAAPGVYLRLRPVEAVYTQLGLYYGRPGFDERDNHGFDWANQAPAELGLFWESGYTYKLAQHPATARFGLSYHTGPVDDFSGTAPEVPPATQQTVPNFYLIHDLELVSDSEGRTKVGLFARGGITPESDRAMVAWYVDGGLDWVAPLPSRSDDVAGIAVSHTGFGDDYRESTGPDGVASGETALELSYRAQITRWMTLQADAQFLFNPAINPDSGSRETATVLGLRAEIRF